MEKEFGKRVDGIRPLCSDGPAYLGGRSHHSGGDLHHVAWKQLFLLPSDGWDTIQATIPSQTTPIAALRGKKYNASASGSEVRAISNLSSDLPSVALLVLFCEGGQY